MTPPAEGLELWHEWISTHSFKVRIVLAEKGLAWTPHPISLFRLEQRTPPYLAINPAGEVPTLVHRGVKLYDSSPIAEYLDEVFPEPPLMPRDPVLRLQARRWLKYHDGVAHLAVRDTSFQLLYKPKFSAMPRAELEARMARLPDEAKRKRFLEGADPQIDWDALARATRAAEAVADRLEASLGAKERWLVGDAFSLGDVAMASFADRVVNLGMEFLWETRPAAGDWARRLLARPGVQAACPPAGERLPVPGADTIAELRRRLGQSATG